MATPILDRISQDLAYKLQDPVTSGSSNGVRISAAERFRYIIRAYRRLLRMVMVLYPNLIQKIFHDFYTEASGTTSSTGRITTLINWSEVFEVFVKEPTDEDYVRANFVSPEDYLKVKQEENAFYVPSLNDNLYFWTRRSDDIYLLPTVILSWIMTYRPDTAKIIEDAGQGGATDIDIATEYQDLLLSLACAEAYLDINQVDAVKAYKQDVVEQLSLMANMSKEKEIKDETKET